MTTSVFVTINPTPEVPGWPVFGMFRPLSAGWLRMLSGVSPCGTCHIISPRSRLIAERIPYGGLKIGSPCTVRPPPAPPAGGLAPDGVGGGGGGGTLRLAPSAAPQVAGPRADLNARPASS